MIVTIIMFIVCFGITNAANDYSSSLRDSNATIAVVIDKEYLASNFQHLKESIQDVFEYSHREILKHGGVNVQYFSWTSINFKRDFTAILSIASCTDTWNLYKEAAGENILFMSISEPDCPRLPSHLTVTVPLLKPGEELPQLLLDLKTSKAYDWKSAIVIYDGTLEHDMIVRVITCLTGFTKRTSNGMALTLVKLKKQKTQFQQQQRTLITETLSKLPLKKLGNNFLVIVSFQYVASIIEVAKSLGMMNPDTQWLYVLSDTNEHSHDISAFANLIGEGDNIAFVYNITTDNSLCTRGVQCHSEELIKAFTATLEKAIQEEDILSRQVSEEEWEAIRPNKQDRRDYLLQGVKTHLMQMGTCNNCTKWRLKSGDTWGRFFTQNHTQELLQVGYWRPSDGISFTDELFPHVVHKFRGRVLPFVTYHNPPWQVLTLNESGFVTEYKGLVFDILEELSRRLNFSYSVQLRKIDISNYTSKDPSLVAVTNTISADIIEMVRNKKVMLGACGITITNKRKKLVNFTTPISIQTHTFLVARPRQLSRALLFISPFTSNTWLCLASAVLTMGPILYFINRYSPVYEYRGKTIKGLTSIQNCMWYMYGALLQQGGMYLPEVDSARMVVGTWWLVVLVVVTTYCGNLVAFLTFPKIDIPIRTIEDLLTHKDTVTWGAIRGSYLEEYLKESDEPKIQSLYNGLISHDQITPEIISQVKARTHVFIDWKTKIAYIMKKNYIETGSCDFAFGKDEFLDEKIAMIVAKDNPYLHMFNKEIIRLHQVGLIDKWLKDYLPKRDRCWKVGHVSEVNNHTVNIDDMQGSFFVLFLGFVLSAALIMLEKFYHRRKLKKVRTVIRPFVS